MAKELRWPENAKIYVTARKIKAGMPKLGKGKFCMSKPVKPKCTNP